MPFDEATIGATEGRIQVTLLREQPDASAVAEALALVPDEDDVVFDQREWFWLPRTGIRGSRLPIARIESILGPMTMRTLGTIERMLTRFP